MRGRKQDQTFVSALSSGKKAWLCDLLATGTSSASAAAAASAGSPAIPAAPFTLPKMAPRFWLTTADERLAMMVLARCMPCTCITQQSLYTEHIEHFMLTLCSYTQ